jgi:hypothetical protein
MIARFKDVIEEQEEFLALQQARLQMLGCGPWPASAASVAPNRATPVTTASLAGNHSLRVRLKEFSFFILALGFMFRTTSPENSNALRRILSRVDAVQIRRDAQEPTIGLTNQFEKENAPRADKKPYFSTIEAVSRWKET